MSWREGNEGITFLVDRLHLGREEESVGVGRVVAHVEGGDTDRVTGGDESGRSDRGIKKDKREHSVEHVAEASSVLLVLEVSCATTDSMLRLATYQVHDDFAIRVRLEGSRVLEAFTEGDMVVNLSVDGKNNGLVIVDQRLSTSVYP